MTLPFTYDDSKLLCGRPRSMQRPILDSFGVLPPTKIDLRTRLNNPIDNLQPWTYSKLEWSSLDEQPNRFEKLGASRTSEACPVYNCHGLTFACRRTQVDGAASTIASILEDDGFKEIPGREARLGDIVVYYGGDGSVIHSGLVVDVGHMNVPKIWSKWGKGYEMLHPLGICPYDASNVRFYRILKWKFQEVFELNS